MAWYGVDKEQCALFCLASGSVSSDKDYEIMYNAYLMIDQEAVARNKESLYFLFVEGGSIPRPNPSWRRRFAELRLLMKAKRRLNVLVTTSAILRGVMTVINWVQPPAPQEEQAIVSTLEEGIRWVETMRGPSRALIERLYQEAREKRRLGDTGLS